MQEDIFEMGGQWFSIGKVMMRGKYSYLVTQE
jgi:hypothetical protein